jgi:hypothetical protein
VHGEYEKVSCSGRFGGLKRGFDAEKDEFLHLSIVIPAQAGIHQTKTQASSCNA